MCRVPNCVSRTKHDLSVWNNLWSRHVNVVPLAEPIRRCVRWRTQVFKIEGFVCKRFLPSPPPPPSFTFWLSFHFSRGQNRKSPSSVFLCSETKRKRLLRRLNFCLRIILWDQFFPDGVMRFYRIRNHNLAPRKTQLLLGMARSKQSTAHSRPDIKKHRYGTKWKVEAEKFLKPTQPKKKTVLCKALSLRLLSNHWLRKNHFPEAN